MLLPQELGASDLVYLGSKGNFMLLIKGKLLKTLKDLAGFSLHSTRLSLLFVIVLALLSAAMFLTTPSLASETDPPRGVEVTTVTALAKHWQLLKWSDDKLVCELFLKHDHWPDYGDVVTSCGAAVWTEWSKTPTCTDPAAATDCKGLYLLYIDQVSMEFVEEVPMPGIDVTLSPVNCLPGEWCVLRPKVELNAMDLLPGYQVSSVHFKVGDRHKVVKGDNGQYTLPPTSQDGAWLEYWAESTYGDRSLPIRIKYRNFKSLDGSSFHFDLLGEDWKDYLSGGSLLWGIFSPLDGSMPAALVQPRLVDELNTANSYLYLSGYLIQSGQVNAGSCSDGGLYIDGSASPCGEEFAGPQAIAWQNQFDEQILQAARKYNVPAHLLKAMIAQESQFWPDTKKPYEKGLGFITENGVDMLLNWNIPYFLNICQPLYGRGICSYGYSSLRKVRQEILRKVVLDKVGGPDEIDILGAMLLASADQSGRLVQNITKEDLDDVTTYVDLWKIATGNYFAGAGCMADAIEIVVAGDSPLTWDNIVEVLSPVCNPAGMYVQQVFEKAGGSE